MAKDFITPEQYQRGVGKIKNYVDQITNSTDIFEKPFIYDEELSTSVKKYVNIKSLSKKTCYRVKNDEDTLSLFLYYTIPNTTDKFNICSLIYPKESIIYINSITDTKASIYIRNFEGSYYITATFGDTLESCTSTKKISVPKLSNTSEFEPTNEYNLTSKKYVDDKVSGIVNSAPETLDTLQELATALGNDPNFATTVATQIGKKVDKVEGMILTHNDLTNELKANYDAAYNYSQAKHSYNDLTDKPTIPSIAGLATTKYVDDTVVFKKLSSIIELSSDGQKIANVEKFEDNKIYYFINDINKGATTLIPISLYKNGEKNSTIIIYPNDRFITMSYDVSANEFFSFSDMQSIKFNLADKTREYNTSRSVTKKVSAEQVLTKTNTTAFTPTSDYHPTTKKYVDDKVTDTATSLTNDPDIYLTKDKYQYVTGVNTVDNIIWLPSTDLPAFLKIHLYATNCKMQSNFDTLVTWKSGQNPNEGKFKIISDNIYEFILTYINGSWIGEVVTYSNTEYTPTNDADVTTKKYVDDRLNNLNIKTVTQSEYDSLESKEPNTLYLITD